MREPIYHRISLYLVRMMVLILNVGRRKNQIQQTKKANKNDDSLEQLAHAKSVIYSLEKKVKDMNVSNRLLTEEMSLIRRLNPQHSIRNPSQNHRIVISDSVGQGCAHSGHNPSPQPQVQHMQNNYSHSGRSWTDGTVQTGLCDYRHALQSSELELRLLRESGKKLVNLTDMLTQCTLMK